MPFITKERLRDLTYAENQLEALRDEDRDIQKDYRKQLKKQERQQWNRYVDLTDELRSDHREEVRELTGQIEDLTDDVEEARKDAKKAKAQITALEKMVSNETEVAQQRIELEAKEAALQTVSETIARREEVVKDAERKNADTLKEHAKEVTTARDEAFDAGHKKGYADGSSDMARTIGELTAKAEERVYNLAEKALSKEVKEPTVNLLTVPQAASNSKK